VSEVDGDSGYYSGEYLQDVLEVTLLELGCEELLSDAHNEAGAYVDEHYPWTGSGDESEERVSAYCAARWWRAEQVRAGFYPP
jgi:hypothetical protein